MESKKPEYKGKIEIACWINKKEDGEEYLNLNIGGLRIPLWKNKPKDGNNM